jgi:UDP-glucuronate decarboxylase
MMDTAGAQIIREDIHEVLAADLPWQKLSGATVAVSGASGFIGSYLVRLLLALNGRGKVDAPVTVIAIIRDLRKAESRFADIPPGAPLHFYHCDLADPQGGPLVADWFIHAASLASPKHYGGNPVGTLAPNVIGTWYLLRHAQAARAKGFVFVSSSEVYGDATGLSALTEADYGRLDPTSVRSVYAESKRMGESLCVAWMHQYKVPAFIVRPFHTYGPGVALDDGRVFADFVADAGAGRDIRLTSDGRARRAFCYISDALSGFFHVVFKGEPGRAYNVANPQAVLSMLELAELIASLAPQKKLRVHRVSPAAAGYLPSPHAQLLPSVAALAGLGWQPRIDAAAGFRRMVESYA